MYPHERSLVKRLAGKPFTLLGVNSDSDREALKKTVMKEDLAWRSWWDGGSRAGPIAETWNVKDWPVLYVLDAKGVIRHKADGSASDETLDKWIDELVAEADKKPK
jgi:hypothetical protein